MVGAAAGVARWFGDHVLAPLPWRSVGLLDTSAAVETVPNPYAVPVRRVRVGHDGPGDADAAAIGLDGPDAVVVVGVPVETLPDVAAWLVPRLAPGARVVDLSSDRVRADEVWARAGAGDGGAAVVGVHALFGITAASADGQTFVVCPAPGAPDAHDWVSDAVEAAGGTVNVLTATRHDEVMRVVQTATHRALLTFADVVAGSGLDIENDLWANRTPLFELLLGLTTRVLAPAQDAATTAIQAADADGSVARAFEEAGARLESAREAGPEALAAHLEALRGPFPGAVFGKIQQAGALATTAVQSTRALISRRRRTHDLVGVESLVGARRVHVGRIERVTPTSFVMSDVLVGRPGRAALLTDETARANARRLGIGGKVRRVEFSLGRVRMLTPEELDAVLDAWLPTVGRGVKVLVPESISGESAVRIVQGVEGVRSVELISEEVRLGQREIVMRFASRLDGDLDDTERAIQHRIDSVFVWPDGVVLPVAPPAAPIAFLGPAGTFSDTAARQLARLVGVPEDVRREMAGFAEVAAAVRAGDVALAVVPIANSSSGLVDLAAEALLDASGGLVAGGVVDVLVRFDAYVAPGAGVHPGAEVLTHPQVIRQCSAFIAANNLVPVECASTVEACRRVAERGAGVAIANVGLEAETGLELARASVGNLAGAVTRFLVVGREGQFGTSPRADATLRTVWLAADAGVLGAAASARFDEVLVGPSGRTLLVSTDPRRIAPGVPGVRLLGTMPWSPRTPLVVVG